MDQKGVAYIGCWGYRGAQNAKDSVQEALKQPWAPQWLGSSQEEVRQKYAGYWRIDQIWLIVDGVVMWPVWEGDSGGETL